MAEPLATLPAMQVARDRSPVPSGPTISVEKVAFFCNPESGARSQALQLRLDTGYKFAVAKAKVFPHLEAWEYGIQRTASACKWFRKIASKENALKNKTEIPYQS
jgi:hypothetical protein